MQNFRNSAKVKTGQVSIGEKIPLMDLVTALSWNSPTFEGVYSLQDTKMIARMENFAAKLCHAEAG